MSAAAMAGRHAANDGSFRRSVFLAAGRAAALVAAAVAIGVFILQATDHSAKKPTVAATASSTTTTLKGFFHAATTTTVRPTTTSTTTAVVKKPAELHVIVMNATGRNGAAAAFSSTVAAKGYQMLPAGSSTKVQVNTVVYYRSGLTREAAALAAAIGNNATTAPLPDKAPGPVPAAAELAIFLGSSAK